MYEGPLSFIEEITSSLCSGGEDNRCSIYNRNFIIAMPTDNKHDLPSDEIFYDADSTSEIMVDPYLRSLCKECSIDTATIDQIKKLILPAEADDLTIVRFLIGTDLEIKTAALKLKEDIEWRAKIQPTNLKRENMLVMIDSGEVQVLNLPDKNGYPTIFIRARLHKAYKYPDTANYQEFMLYTVEKLLQSNVRVSAIADISAFGWKNLDISFIVDAIRIYNDHYPERLGDLIFISGQFWFEYGFRICKHLLGPRTLPRVHYLKTLQELEKFIDPIALPEDCSLIKTPTISTVS
ncbi:hypothetical protein GJ496_009201 [Pomphorhynchus laevis]|nr:hypothetical protein GJ496_009201 [Pomphorhynchus laevis]